MITEQDLREAIAECQGQRNPNASTCIKLAAFLTIQRELFGQQQDEPTYSFAAPPASEPDGAIGYESDTEFGMAVRGMYSDDVLSVMDELMSILSAVNAPLYASVMRKLQNR